MEKRTNLGVEIQHANGLAWVKCDTNGDITKRQTQRAICRAIEKASNGKYRAVSINNYKIL